jgi:quercetin dioxygenase-like cupin family protein
MPQSRAEILLPALHLNDELAFFTKTLGFRLEAIWPADDPQVAVISGHGLRLRLDAGQGAAPARLLLATDDPAAWPQDRLTSPAGTQVEITPLAADWTQPPTEHDFVLRRLADGAPWVIGRAGMQYRDLIPSRLGGSIIASHIRIPDGGPVPDMVHFHRVGFQLIFCVAGWVDVVYEDQGGPIRLHPGDCFIQPPEIRHRVLEASDGIEVIEIGVPAEHVTEIDHDMTLPTPHLRPDRVWQGQRFVHNRAEGARFMPFRLPGFVARDTTIHANTGGVASVMVARPDGQPTGAVVHQGDILFTYVLSGGLTVAAEGHDPAPLRAGDAFVIPPGLATHYRDLSPDLELLEVSLPGQPPTRTLSP